MNEPAVPAVPAAPAETVVMTSGDIARSLKRIAHEILERNRGSASLALIGIRTRGVFLAERLRDMIREIEKVEIPIGSVDTTLYRDDLRKARTPHPVREMEIDFSVDDRDIVLVDDVLYTGRSIRAAMDALMDFGRPRTIQLAILVDRGHRELPIRADYVGKNLPTSAREDVRVRLTEKDGKEEVVLFRADGGRARW
jgi:pyrimidine operon attenuation protein/uracil phosphoribosyltransferase